jgi:flagellin
VSGSLTIDNATGFITLAAGAAPLAAETYTIVRTVTHDGDSNGVVNTYKETLTLTLSDYKHTDTYTVTATDSSVLATDNITITSTASDKFVDNIALSVTANVDHLADVDVSTQAGAARAVTILDKALDTISSSQAKLGAIQNRLSHNIDNLSTSSMLTETARGRILDADFARETSELSKQQILGQAATSMLAQANQSKQSILALLQ